jgi:hypothetical protein
MRIIFVQVNEEGRPIGTIKHPGQWVADEYPARDDKVTLLDTTYVVRDRYWTLESDGPVCRVLVAFPIANNYMIPLLRDAWKL